MLLSDDFLVLDEAQTVAQVATQHFGQRITSYGLDRLLKRIFNPRNRYGLLGLWVRLPTAMKWNAPSPPHKPFYRYQ